MMKHYCICALQHWELRQSRKYSHTNTNVGVRMYPKDLPEHLQHSMEGLVEVFYVREHQELVVAIFE